MQETLVRFLGPEDPLEECMATHSSILAWRIPIDRGAWRAAVHGVAEPDMTEQLSIVTHLLSLKELLVNLHHLVEESTLYQNGAEELKCMWNSRNLKTKPDFTSELNVSTDLNNLWKYHSNSHFTRSLFFSPAVEDCYICLKKYDSNICQDQISITYKLLLIKLNL